MTKEKYIRWREKREMLTTELFINEQLLSSLNNKSNNGREKFRPIVSTSLLTKVSPFYERLTKDLGLQFWEVQFPRQ